MCSWTKNDDDSVIPVITPELFHQYVQQGIIGGGMIPKLENALAAVAGGVEKVIITAAEELGRGGGTVIKNKKIGGRV